MDKILQKTPSAINALYIIQACSTFSYAILYSSLSLYLTQQMGLSSTFSISIVGLFLSFNYVLHLLGGLIGGRYLNNRFLFLICIIMQSIGMLLLAFSNITLLFTGISLFLVGCGLKKTSYNNMLMQYFEADDTGREKAFFISYAAMNVGFFLGFTISGFYDYSNQYQSLFYIGMFTNFTALLFLILNWSNYADQNTFLSALQCLKKQRFNNVIGITIILSLIPLLRLFFYVVDFSNSIVILTSISMFLFILFLSQQQNHIDKQRIRAYLILAMTSTLFWMIYYTGPMGVMLFIKQNVDKHVFNVEIASQWILNINPIVIIIAAPTLAIIIEKLKAKGFNITTTSQFLCGFIMLALSFFLLACGIKFANSNGYISISWVFLYDLVQSIAEVLIAPVGYAMVGRIAPAKLQGLLMGTWMMISGVAASLAHYFSSAMVKTQAGNPLLTNPDYFQVFMQLGICALMGAAFLYLTSEKISRLINTTKH